MFFSAKSCRNYVSGMEGGRIQAGLCLAIVDVGPYVEMEMIEQN